MKSLVIFALLWIGMVSPSWGQAPLLDEQAIPGYHLLKSSRDTVEVAGLLKQYPRMDAQLFAGQTKVVSLIEHWLNLTKQEWNKQNRENDPKLKIRSIFLERTELQTPQQAIDYATNLARRSKLKEGAPDSLNLGAKCWYSEETTLSSRGPGYFFHSVLCLKNMVAELVVNGEGVTKDGAVNVLKVTASRI